MRPVFSAYADNFFLPLALLADNTFLPPAVLILDLKPCTLALCLFLGWNVIFIGMHLLYTTGLKYRRTSAILLCILEYHVYYIRIPYLRQVDFALSQVLCRLFLPIYKTLWMTCYIMWISQY